MSYRFCLKRIIFSLRKNLYIFVTRIISVHLLIEKYSCAIKLYREPILGTLCMIVKNGSLPNIVYYYVLWVASYLTLRSTGLGYLLFCCSDIWNNKIHNYYPYPPNSFFFHRPRVGTRLKINPISSLEDTSRQDKNYIFSWKLITFNSNRQIWSKNL